MPKNKSEFARLKNASTTKITIPFDNNPKTIKVLTGLPKSGQCEIREVPLADIEAKYGFSYLSGLEAPDLFAKKYLLPKLDININFLSEKVGKGYTNFYLRDFAICDLESGVGAGLFYVGKATIPAGTYIAVYTGELSDLSEAGDEPYACAAKPSKLFGLAPRQEQSSSAVDAGKKGNLTRFINHALPKEELQTTYEFAPGLAEDQVLGANLQIVVFTTPDSELPFCMLKTTEDIHCGKQVFYSYDNSYWYNQLRYDRPDAKLFSKCNQLIEPYLYRRKEVPVIFSYKDEGKRYTIFPPEKLPLILGLGFFALNDEPGKPDTFDVSFVKQSMRAHGYSDFPSPTIDYAYEPKNIIDSSAAIHLRAFIDPEFKCYKRTSHCSDDFAVDAVLRIKSLVHLQLIIKKIEDVGIYPLVNSTRLIIANINDPAVIPSIQRLIKKMSVSNLRAQLESNNRLASVPTPILPHILPGCEEVATPKKPA